ncbi:MAG: hypothetical protein QM529_06595, partial [Hydrotalea sp.]|nr:hypothetical protein [Hydrotalea sp.]
MNHWKKNKTSRVGAARVNARRVTPPTTKNWALPPVAGSWVAHNHGAGKTMARIALSVFAANLAIIPPPLAMAQEDTTANQAIGGGGGGGGTLLADTIRGKITLTGNVGYVFNLPGTWNRGDGGTTNATKNGGLGYGASLGYVHSSGWGLSADYLGFAQKWSSASGAEQANSAGTYNYDAGFHVITLTPSYRFQLDKANNWGLKIGVGVGVSISDLAVSKQGPSGGNAASNGTRVAGGAAYTYSNGNDNTPAINNNCPYFTDSVGETVRDGTYGLFHISGGGNITLPTNSCIPAAMLTNGNNGAQATGIYVADQADFDTKLAAAVATIKAADPTYTGTMSDAQIKSLLQNPLTAISGNGVRYTLPSPWNISTQTYSAVALGAVPNGNNDILYGATAGAIFRLSTDIATKQAAAANPTDVQAQLDYTLALQQKQNLSIQYWQVGAELAKSSNPTLAPDVAQNKNNAMNANQGFLAQLAKLQTAVTNAAQQAQAGGTQTQPAWYTQLLGLGGLGALQQSASGASQMLSPADNAASGGNYKDDMGIVIAPQVALEYDNGFLHADINCKYIHELKNVIYYGDGSNYQGHEAGGKTSYTAQAGPLAL